MDQTTGDMRPSDPYSDPYIEPIPDVNAGATYDEQVAAGDNVTYAELTERGPSGGVTSDESSDDIREDIEQTRANMGDTIDSIQERLSPERLTQQAKDVVHDATIGRVEQTMNDMTDSAREGGYTLLDTIRQNPIPAALAGIGVGWLVMKVRENAEQRSWNRNWNRDGRYQRGYQPGFQRQYDPARQYGQYGQYQQSYSYQGSQQSDQSLTDKAQDKMGQVANKAQDRMSQVGDKAQDMGGQLQDQAQQVASQAQYQAYRARNWFERTMDENPLAIGLVAVAAGALAGMAVPETDQERQWMGPARDQLVEKAQDVAQTTADKAQTVAQQATDAAKDAAKDEAKNQNLIH
ncbi:MAG TPA: DUF3618 domain-containing protein [Ktedonobacterales bacterium]|jgi:ElaB/YqjD/DUF883 family membrane-anchored ribosome-binding protein|nr:DUF3618 domain-containing protein [Ktedonobacterales bacterium]